MSGPASGDAFFVAKCLEFCQALSSQGQVFNISISTGSGFSFSLDTRSKAEALKCDQCEYVGASEKGLKQHMRMKHKNIAPLQSTPEIPRSRDASSLPVRQSEIIDQGPWKEHAYLEAGLDECPVCHVKRPNSCDFWVDHPIVPKK